MMVDCCKFNHMVSSSIGDVPGVISLVEPINTASSTCFGKCVVFGSYQEKISKAVCIHLGKIEFIFTQSCEYFPMNTLKAG